MCGITGCWILNSRPLDRADMDKFIDSLAHRGPDGRGTYFDSNDSLFLGHRRLAILDLSSSGAQPMSCPDGRYTLTFNGEIYNFIEIRQELESFGYRFRSDSDTEVLLAAYQQWGEDCQLKFNGMWAFAIWDRLRKTLFLSRDRFGIKPLHYWYDGTTFAFASELKAFLALAQWPYAIDERSIGLSIVAGSFIEGTENTILKGVKRLLGGHSLTMRRGCREPAIRRWWNTLDHLETPPKNYDDRVARFQELFDNSCRLRMRSDVPIGTALSGGLDSSAVLGTLSHLARSDHRDKRFPPEWHTSFVSSYPGTPQDETKHANHMLQTAGAKGEFMTIEPCQALDNLDSITFSSEEVFPFRGTVWHLYKHMREKGIVVSMDGHAGDELLAGYHHYPAFQMLDAAIAARPGLPSIAPQRAIARSMFSTGELPENYTLKRVIAHNLPSPIRIFRTAWLAEPEYHSIFLNYAADQSRLASASNLQRSLYYDFHHSNLPTILRNFDRFSMAHGVEIRTPFLDWRLVCYGFSLPDQDKLGGGYAKRILRDACRERMPDSIRLRKDKIGFLEPFTKWLENGFRERLLEIVNDSTFLNNPIWNGPLVRDITNKANKENRFSSMQSPWLLAHSHLLMSLFKSQRQAHLSSL